MLLIWVLMLLFVPLPSLAAVLYVSPVGSGDDCTLQSPCTMTTGVNNAVGSDTVRFLDGTYTLETNGFRTLRNGTSSSARLTYESVNPRGAVLRFNGTDNSGGLTGDTLIVEHDNIIIRGFEVNCTSSSGNNAWDCVQVNGVRLSNEVQNVLFENLYVYDGGHALFGCYLATGIELRNSTFDQGGIDTQDSGFGECNYFSSSGNSSGNNICTIDNHHNMFGRCRGNLVDHKSQTRNAVVRDSVFIDKRSDGADGLGGGDGDFISQRGQHPTPGATGAGNLLRNTISYRAISSYVFKSTDGHRIDFLDNVVVDWVRPGGGAKNLNYAGGWSPASAISSNNIHCGPSDGASLGPDQDGGGAPNQVNRPYAECTDRINQILGRPGISSCEIGSVNSTTLVVNLQANVNGPVSSVGAPGDLAVTYNSVGQTENSISLITGTQAHIIMAAAPTAGQTVQVTPAVGSIKNSAFIGGRNCDMPLATLAADPGGSNLNPNKILDGRGLCGSNQLSTPATCTNNVGGTPAVETLDQAVYRFYASDLAEGAGALGDENVSLGSLLGDTFRWRVGVRGGGTNAPARAYRLAARLCNPACGAWVAVSGDGSATGIQYAPDDGQLDGAATTNQLSLGGKTFVAGAFQETDGTAPSVAITTTQQVEWEHSLEIPRDNNPAVVGNTIELRMEHGNGTALSAYTSPSISIGVAGSGITGVLTGTFQ